MEATQAALWLVFTSSKHCTDMSCISCTDLFFLFILFMINPLSLFFEPLVLLIYLGLLLACMRRKISV